MICTWFQTEGYAVVARDLWDNDTLDVYIDHIASLDAPVVLDNDVFEAVKKRIEERDDYIEFRPGLQNRLP